MKPMNFPGRKEQRRQDAENRQVKFDKLLTQEKHDKAFSINPNSKETAKWAARLEQEKQAPKEAKKKEEIDQNVKTKKKRLGKRRQEVQAPAESE
jgi:hypothetical protein